MTRRLLVAYITVTVLVLAALVLPLGLTFASREANLLLSGIERDTTAVAALVEPNLAGHTAPRLNAVLAGYRAGGGRIVVVTTQGVSVADSDDIGGVARDFSTRPEIRAALSGRRSEGIRPSETLGHSLMYVALPVSAGGTVYGVVRVTYPTTDLDAAVSRNWLRLALLSAAILLAVAAIGFVLARGVSRPVRNLRAVAGRLSLGRLDARADTDTGTPELRALGGTFNAMAERLQRLVEAQRLFVADASHQLRTPLTALRLRLETLEPHLPTAQRNKLDAAVDETVRLGRLVDSLLTLARADADADPVPVDPVDIAFERAETWSLTAAEQGVRLDVRSRPCPQAMVVPGGLEQILDNLLSNAISASPPRGVVIVRITPDGPGWVDLRVIDEGRGLGDAERAMAFERFWRAKGAPAGGGFGLGLAIARRLAEVADGTVVLAESPTGTGLQAIVRLRAGARALTSG
ncbi:MAG TPA: ATP-binding protein [Pseudonocardiaceae bacterium]